MGIRQKVAKFFASEPNVEGKLGEKAEEGVIVSPADRMSYSQRVLLSLPASYV
jgi:hypothetical protein